MENDRNTQQVNGRPFSESTRAILEAIATHEVRPRVTITLIEYHELISKINSLRGEIDRLTDIKSPKLTIEVTVGKHWYRNEIHDMVKKLGLEYISVSVEDLPNNEKLEPIYKLMREQLETINIAEENVVELIRGLNNAHERVNRKIDDQIWWLRWLYRKWALTPDDNRNEPK